MFTHARMYRLCFVMAFATVCFALAGCGGPASTPQPTPPPKATATSLPPTAPPTQPPAEHPEQISFVSKRDGNLEIYLVNADGSDLVNLTNSTSNDQSPAWSPDGARFVFTSDRDGIPSLYIMDVAAALQGNQAATRLTDFPSGNAAWSPDGKQIAFLGDNKGALDIFLISPDGSGLKNLGVEPGPGDGPTWAPDNTRLIFYSASSGNANLYGVNVDGTKLTQLTDWPEIEVGPDWSSKNRLAFASNHHGNFEIFTLEASGEIRRLTNNTSNENAPTWSPDGSQLAFETDVTGNLEIAIIRADNTVFQLTKDPADDRQPAWRP